MAPRILVVEDEPNNALVLSRRLDLQGFEVITAQDGEQGLERARKERPDLLLLDVVVPGCDGLRVCRELKQDDNMRDIPIIIVTATGNKDIETLCLEAGAEKLIRKPFQTEELVKSVKAALGIPWEERAGEVVE